MPDQHIHVKPDAVRHGDGTPIVTKQQAEQAREQWTAQNPPLPGLRWVISFNLHGEISSRHLEVIPGWEDAYATPVATRPTSAAKNDLTSRPDEADRLGALAYHGWFNALPKIVRDSSDTKWGDLAEPFRQPMREAAALVWQHAENTGFHEALLRTLPSAQLGAAGELENLADLIMALRRLHGDQFGLDAVLGEISKRVTALRHEAAEGAKRARKRNDQK